MNWNFRIGPLRFTKRASLIGIVVAAWLVIIVCCCFPFVVGSGI